MYDACTPGNIPANAGMVAGYIYGNCAWSMTAWAAFPNAVKVRIATVAWLDDGQVLDVESGDATPALAPGWCVRARARGQIPTVYCSVAALPSVMAAFAAAKVTPPHYWLAHYGIAPVLLPGSVATQYQNTGV